MVFDDPTFGEIARLVIASKEPPARSPASFRSAKLHIGRLIDYFGNKPIIQIREADWVDYVKAQKAINPTRRLWHDRVHFRMVWTYAIREGWVTKKLELSIPDRPRSIGRELSEDEIKALLEHASPRLRFQIEIAVRMGLRKGEVMRLNFNQFDWCSRMVHLSAENTKTRKARVVPISPDLLTRFQLQCAMGRSDWVFPSKLDPSVPMGHNHTAWRRCKRKAQVNCRFHDLRHTAATRLARAGVPIHVASKMLGMSETILRTVYQHASYDDLKLAAKALSGRR